MKKTMERLSNFEILRIISMLLIICHHFALYSGFRYPSSTITMNSVFIQFLSYGGQLGVNLFVLISGYFLVKNEFKVKKAVKLWMDISIYAIIIMLIFAIAGTDFNFFEVVKNIFPIPYNMWWFATSYFMMYLLSGYINKLICALSKRELDHLILLLIVICSILPTFMAARMTSTLMWFFLLYIIAAWIRLYALTNKVFDHSLMIGAIGYVFCLGSCVLFDIIGTKIAIFSDYATYFARIDSITMLFCSIFLFIGFKNLNIKHSKVINTIAATTFGVYLLHENEYIRPFLWKTVFHSAEHANDNRLILYAIGAILATFALCSFISYTYNKTIGRWINALLTKAK